MCDAYTCSYVPLYVSVHICVHVCGSQRSVYLSPLVILYLISLRKGFLLNPERTSEIWQQASECLSPLLSWAWNYSHRLPRSTFYMRAGVGRASSCFYGKRPADSNFPSPQNIVLYIYISTCISFMKGVKPFPHLNSSPHDFYSFLRTSSPRCVLNSFCPVPHPQPPLQLLLWSPGWFLIEHTPPLATIPKSFSFIFHVFSLFFLFSIPLFP